MMMRIRQREIGCYTHPRSHSKSLHSEPRTTQNKVPVINTGKKFKPIRSSHIKPVEPLEAHECKLLFEKREVLQQGQCSSGSMANLFNLGSERPAAVNLPSFRFWLFEIIAALGCRLKLISCFVARIRTS